MNNLALLKSYSGSKLVILAWLRLNWKLSSDVVHAEDAEGAADMIVAVAVDVDTIAAVNLAVTVAVNLAVTVAVNLAVTVAVSLTTHAAIPQSQLINHRCKRNLPTLLVADAVVM
jgi:hypothetical protein